MLLPKEYANTVFFANETEYSFMAYVMDFFQVQYTSWPLAFVEKYDLFVKLVGKNLTRTLKTESVAKTLSEDARECLTQCWGEDTENWVEVPLYATLEKMCARMINVLAIGPAMSEQCTVFTDNAAD